MLRLKSVFLLAITRPSWSADLSQLDTSRMRPAGNGVSLSPSALAKQSRQGKPIETFFFPSFPQNPILCPVETISVYIDKTNQIGGNETRLFLSFIKPQKAVTSSTIARWLRKVLEQARINTEIFRAHSTRGASASAAARGRVTLEDILKAANWSSESVFQKFYNKEFDRAAYRRAESIRIAWEKLRTTQLICETEPSEMYLSEWPSHEVAASYSRLYEGKVDHINCPHSPSQRKRRS
uniref:Tyr recombinase domain-containing protein n=1 Tax=Amphimedon queenslandica TaxID=400682 RepID=A0A1X7UXX1_AMPQE